MNGFDFKTCFGNSRYLYLIVFELVNFPFAFPPLGALEDE